MNDLELSGWTLAWLIWLGLFLAIELPAAFNKEKGDTLSEHVWKWFNIKNKAEPWNTRRAILALSFLALGAHFLYKATVIPVVITLTGVAYVIYKSVKSDD
jgi:hypothetical protein